MIDRSQKPRLGPVRPFTFPSFDIWQLDNGLNVMAAPDPRVPMVMIRLVMGPGADQDPADAPGLTALTAALLDEGTTSRSSLELAAAAERLGGYLTTSADWDCTRIETSLLSQDLAIGLDLVADVAMNPVFPEEEVERLKRQTMAHIRRRKMQPAVVAQDHFHRALYGSGPYSRPLLGTEDSIAAIERSQVVDHHRSLSFPGAATIIIAGSYARNELAERVEQALGTWSAEADARSDVAEPCDPRRVRLLLIDRPEAPQSELCLGHLGLPRNHADYSLAAVANALLGGKFTSRINLKLREEHACTYGAHSSFAKRRGAGPFTVTAAIDNDAVPLAIREVLRELDRLRQETVPEDELAETIDYLIGSFPYSCETLAGIVHRLSDLAIFQLPKTYYDELPAALAAVTPDEIMRCARQHIHPHRAVIVVAGPADSLTNQLADIAAVERP